MPTSPFEPVIGLEVHAQLKTRSKTFCACPVTFGAPPNTAVCPVCLGYPGTLPVPNREMVTLALRVALAAGLHDSAALDLRAEELLLPGPPEGLPDLAVRAAPRDGRAHRRRDGRRPPRDPPEPHPPRGGRGQVHARGPVGRRAHVRVPRGPEPRGDAAHRDRDGARPRLARRRPTTTSSACAASCAGWTPRTGTWRKARCAATRTSRSARAASRALGTKVEIKNLNSIAHVKKALEHEIARQAAVLSAGGTVVQETRLFEPGTGATKTMRSKEEAMDYRYFPDPDLGALEVDAAWVEDVKASLPEMPEPRAARFAAQYALPAADAELLCSARPLADWYEEAVAAHPSNPKARRELAPLRPPRPDVRRGPAGRTRSRLAGASRRARGADRRRDDLGEDREGDPPGRRRDGKVARRAREGEGARPDRRRGRDRARPSRRSSPRARSRSPRIAAARRPRSAGSSGR